MSTTRPVPNFDDLTFLHVHPLAGAARGLPRALRHRDGARHAVRRAAAAAEDPDHRLRHVVRRAVAQRQGRHRPRREPRRHVDHDRRRRHAPDGAGATPTASSTRSARATTGTTRTTWRAPTRSRSSSARAPSRAPAACCWAPRCRTRWRGCATCRSASTSARRCATPTSSGPPTCASRSSRSARRPTGRSRSTSRSARPATRDDVKLAAKAGADVIVIDGMEGGSAATPDILYDHTGIPTMAAICEARRALEDMGLLGEVQIVLQGGIKNGADVAKALALGRGRGRRRLGRHDRARLQLAATTSRTTTRSASSPATAPCATPASARSASRRRTSA